MLAVGLVIGGMLAVWAGQAATTLLYGLKPHDPITMVAAMALLTAVALGRKLRSGAQGGSRRANDSIT